MRVQEVIILEKGEFLGKKKKVSVSSCIGSWVSWLMLELPQVKLSVCRGAGAFLSDISLFLVSISGGFPIFSEYRPDQSDTLPRGFDFLRIEFIGITEKSLDCSLVHGRKVAVPSRTEDLNLVCVAIWQAKPSTTMSLIDLNAVLSTTGGSSSLSMGFAS